METPEEVGLTLHNENTAASLVESDASSESSTPEPVKEAVRSKKKYENRKIHNYKRDKPWFDSYNVFNRELPPNVANVGVGKAKMEFGGGDGPEGSTVLECEGNEGSRGPNRQQRMPKRVHLAKTLKAKRQIHTKKSQLKPIMKSAKSPISEELAREIDKQARQYLRVLQSKPTKQQNCEQETTELNVEEDPKSDDGKDDSESKEDLFKTIMNTRKKSDTKGFSWNRGLMFVDQGLAYNEMATVSQSWVNNEGVVVTDLSDPATDAVRLVGLSMGGLIVAQGKNPYDYTNSYLDAMIKKYPVLVSGVQNHRYDAALNTVAEIFPTLVTTHYMLMGDPLLDSMAKLSYGLPLIIYLEGFPSLVCQHHLEKDYNILPFLMVSMIVRLGPIFKEANPAGRLEMARIAWKYLKASIDSPALPWYFRELFCRKYGVCNNPDFYPGHCREREKATMDLATLVGHADVTELLAQMDEYNYRTGCPLTNQLKPSNEDMYYMNIFYSRAVKHLQVGHKRKQNQNVTAADSTVEQDSEIQKILENANRVIDDPQLEYEGNPQNRWFVRLDDEIY